MSAFPDKRDWPKKESSALKKAHKAAVVLKTARARQLIELGITEELAEILGVKPHQHNATDLKRRDFDAYARKKAPKFWANYQHPPSFYLRGINLPHSLLVNLTFSEETNFIGARLSHTDFRGSRLIRAQFIRAVLLNTDFAGADVSGADFTDSWMDGANFYKTRISGTILPLGFFKSRGRQEAIYDPDKPPTFLIGNSNITLGDTVVSFKALLNAGIRIGAKKKTEGFRNEFVVAADTMVTGLYLGDQGAPRLRNALIDPLNPEDLAAYVARGDCDPRDILDAPFQRGMGTIHIVEVLDALRALTASDSPDLIDNNDLRAAVRFLQEEPETAISRVLGFDIS